MTTRSERTWALAAHLASLVAGGLYLVRVNRTQWFFGDEWEFLGGARRALPWYDQYLTPHNEHWSTAPYAIYRLLESLFGIRSYWPYILTAIFIHLVVVHLVWRVMVQGRVSPWIATVTALPLIVLGAGAQDLLWAFQIGFLGSVALGLGAILLANHEGAAWKSRDWGALALALFALSWSGVSVLMVGICTLVITLRRGIRPAAAFVVAPAAVYVVWAIAYPPPTNLAAPSLRAFADGVWPFVATGLSTAADAFVFDLPLLGSLLLVALAVYLVRTAARARTEAAAVYACALGAVAQYLLSAYGRLKLGTGQASETRYGYIAIVLVVPAVAMVADRLLSGRHLTARVAFVGLFVALGFMNAHLLRLQASDDERRERALQGLILSAAQIANDPTQRLAPGARPEPRYSPDLTVADLRRFASAGELPRDQQPLERRLTAAANLQIGVTASAALKRCPAAPLPAVTVVHAGPTGVRAVVYGAPGAVVSVSLVDPATGVTGEQRQLVLPASWNLLSVYRSGVDVSVATPPNAHVCRAG